MKIVIIDIVKRKKINDGIVPILYPKRFIHPIQMTSNIGLNCLIPKGKNSLLSDKYGKLLM
jgi:hypothetical protein